METGFKTAIAQVNAAFLRRLRLETLQVNLGNMCNQRCIHCHIDASPAGNKVMFRRTIEEVVDFLSRSEDLTLDITGGCPELNPHFRYLVVKAGPHVKKIMVRSNLTVLFETGMEDLPAFYKTNRVKLICSLPCYTKENVDKQRGQGVFDKSIRALELLNQFGYGKEKYLELDLVYNPGGAFLPANQAELEKEYKKILYRQYGIVFNRLLTITNAPINRFEQFLKANGNFDEYMKLLINSFNRDIAGNVMCRNLLSVGWDGAVYDCDFNQARGLALKDGRGKIMKISRLNPQDLEGKEIIFENHCYCCTAGGGSSCRGSLS
jgi:radical SAM/Cys-rich protein